MSSAIGPVAAVLGLGMNVGGTILSANDQGASLTRQATQYDFQAGQVLASSQRDAMEQQRQAQLVQSRALAVAAASGAGASDPTVVADISNIAGEGEYRALTSLYEGKTKADSMYQQAAALRTDAGNVKKAGAIKAVGTLLTGGGTLLEKYG